METVKYLLGGINLSGTLIRLFLVDGNPKGLRTIEISNMTIYATIFPRTKLKEFLNRDEAEKPGCYILLGENIDDPDRIKIYVGEGESVKERLKSHSSGKKQKDFWNEAIVFTSKDNYITKTQIQYLEAEIYKLIDETERAIFDNDQKPKSPILSEVDTAEMTQFLDAIKLILLSLGIDILESKKIKQKSKSEKEAVIYEFSIKDAKGKMRIEESDYIVLKGSTAVLDNRKSADSPIISLRESLIKSGVLKKDSMKNLLYFTVDYKFRNPSYAAAAISGGNQNGRESWKNKGKNLKEIELEEIE